MATTREISRPEVFRLPERGQLGQLPWWAFIIVATGLLLIYLILASPNYHDTFIYLQAGIAMTLRITLTAFPIATVIGLVAGLARTSKRVVPYTLSTLYVELIRGVPLVVLMLYFAFGIVPVGIELLNKFAAWGLTWADNPSLVNLFTSWSDRTLIRKIPDDMRAIIALAFGYGAYEAEVFRAGIQSIGKGQMEAARSLGMSYIQAMRLIILPQAIRRVLPPLGNDFIALLKDSSLATVLAVNELTQMGRLRRASTFRVMETFNVVAFLYLAMTLLLSGVVRFMERKFKIEE
jgi:polar amino acid transport system permease protein